MRKLLAGQQCLTSYSQDLEFFLKSRKVNSQIIVLNYYSIHSYTENTTLFKTVLLTVRFISQNKKRIF